MDECISRQMAKDAVEKWVKGKTTGHYMDGVSEYMTLEEATNCMLGYMPGHISCDKCPYFERYNNVHDTMPCKKVEAHDIAVAALAKQIPMKPKKRCYFFDYWTTEYDCCPNCGVRTDGLPKYCDNCGQRIDWNE